MNTLRSPVDTFSNTFSSEQFVSPHDASPSPPSGQQDDTSPESNHATSHSPHSPQSQAPPNSASGGPAPGPRLNPRSCVTCRKRKVRCDKLDPCTNCQKAGIECVFPQPGRAPRRSKKPADVELLARLSRLEGVVQKLGKGVDGEDLEGGEKNQDTTKRAAPNRKDTGSEQNGSQPKPPSNNDLVTQGRNSNTLWNIEAEKGASSPAEGLERFKQFSEHKRIESGKLVVGEGRSRYVSNSFWTGLTEEVRLARPSSWVFNTAYHVPDCGDA